MNLILPLLIFLAGPISHAEVEIQTYKKNYSWNNSWNHSISFELDQKKELIIMNGKIDHDDLKELGCVGFNNVTDNDFKKDFWIVFFSALTRAESAFNTKARSHTNHGLLQLTKTIAKTQCGLNSLEEIGDANEHLRCGVKLLSWQLQGAPTSNGKQRRPDFKGQLFGKRILLWGPLRKNDVRGRALLVGWFKKHLDQLPFCTDKLS